MLAEGEWKKVAAIVGVCAAASVVAERRRRILDEKDAIENKMPVRERSFLEHPFMAFLVENGTCISLVALATKIPLLQGGADKNQILNYPLAMLRNLVVVEGAILTQDLILSKLLYSNVPFFSGKRPAPTMWDMVTDWLQCNFAANTFNGYVQFLIVSVLKPELWFDVEKSSTMTPVRVVPFLLKLAFSRFVCDIVFHVAHRWMHMRSVYKQLHARHHEHNKCVLATNFHFTWMDIFLEAAAPFWVAFGSLFAIGHEPTQLEGALIATYITWFEIASHSGKEIPYATMFPPLAPLMNAFTDIDRDNIKYHETHHNLVRCNYGITQWVDKLAGTHRLQKQPCEIGMELQVQEIPDEEDAAASSKSN